MKRTLSRPEKIRAVRKELRHWMALRQKNPVMARNELQETAERESLRLANMLDRLETRQRAQMAAVEQARKDGLL